MSIQANKDRFKEDWNAALRDMKMTPPGRVWQNIDRSLAYADASRYRKKAFYYKWAAVVAIIIAFSASIPYTWESLISTKELYADVGLTDGNGVPPVLFERQTSSQAALVIVEGEDENNNENTRPFVLLTKSNNNRTSKNTIEDKTILAGLEKKSLQGEKVNVDGHYVDPVPIYHFEAHSFRNDQTGKFWAGIGVSSSSFDPNYQLHTTNVVANALLSSQPNFVNTTDNGHSLTDVSEHINQGVNYQVGLNMGMRVARRWTLESGMNYGEALLSTTTNVVIENRYFSKAIALTSEASNFQEVEQIAKTKEIVEYVEDDVIMNNTFQFASIPLKAGYILLDKKFNIRLNAGLVTNIYLGNVLEDPDKNLATIEISPGDDSPYRTVNFSGLAGVSLGYRLLDNFDLMVEPNYSHSLQPLTKSSSNFAATPSGLGISAGIRYNFRR